MPILPTGSAAPAVSPRWSVLLRVTVLGLICWVVIFWRLSYLPLLDPDEAHYAQITREMMQGGQWMVPTLEGAPLIDKPILFHWIQGASFWLLGVSEFAARLPTALSALGLLGLTFWCGRRLFGREVAERAALMLVLTPLLFKLSSVALFDMLFTTFLFGAFACLVVAAVESRPRMQVPAAVLLSLAVQIKGPVGFVLIALAAGVAALFREPRALLRRLQWLKIFAGAGLLAAPWFVWMWFHFGQAFIDQYVLLNNLSLFAAPLYRQKFYPFFFVRVFATAFFPWSWVVIGRIVDTTWERRWRALSPATVLLWVWTAVIFIFFSASRFKIDTYIFPLAPSACLLAACAWQEVSAGQGVKAYATRASLLLVALLLIGVGAAAAFAYFFVDLRLSYWSLIVPGVAIVGGAVFLGSLLMRRLTPRGLELSLVVTLLCIYGGVAQFGFAAYTQARPAPRLSQRIASLVGPTDRVAVFRQERWKASVRFYSGRAVSPIETTEELRRLLDGPDRAFCIMTSVDAERLQAIGIPLRVIDRAPGVTATSGRGLRQQIWGDIVVATNR